MSDFPKIGAPALRALASAGYTRLSQLRDVSDADLLKLHGMGPKALGILRAASAPHGAKAPKPKGVDGFMAGVSHPLKPVIEALRAVFLSASPKLEERIKWNAPSYFYRDVDMGAFNLQQEAFVQFIMLFPKGMLEDPSRLMQGEWQSRRELRFADLDDVRAKEEALRKLVKQWIQQIDAES